MRLARRISGSIADFDQALAELDRAVELAIEVRQAGAQGSNLSGFVDDVLRRLADLTAAGEYDAAGEEADAAIAQWERDEAERQARATAELARLLEAGERQALLRGDAESAAVKIARRALLDTPEADRFDVLRRVQDEWYVRGRDKGLNIDSEVSIALARTTLDVAAGADQRGSGLNDLGDALQTLGAREPGIARMEQAVAAYRAALTEWTQNRVPLDWAMTQNNLGAALQTLGEREPGTARLEQAVAAFRAALTEQTQDRVPLQWAATQNNLGNALQTLGERESGTECLEQAVYAYNAALTEYTQDRVPLDWAMTQNNLGNALREIAARTGDYQTAARAVAAQQGAVAMFRAAGAAHYLAITERNLAAARALRDRLASAD
jgi:hypothetical protein